MSKNPLQFNIDVAALTADFKQFAMEVEQDLQKAAGALAAMTKAKVDELASQELTSTLEQFKKSVGWEEISPGIYVVYINEDALWQEDGLPAGFDMKPGLLKGATKISKDGHPYRSIPFDHGKAPTQQTSDAQRLTSQVKSFLKKEKVPFRKIELNADKSPRTGQLHRFNIPSDAPTDRASTSALQGLTIYQTRDTSKPGNIRRDIMTFRTVSGGEGSQGKWIHPGYKPKNFLEKAGEWAEKEWENTILPEITSKWK